MSLLKNTQFICLDCEFTGLDPEKDRILEVAAIRFTLSENLSEFSSLVDPECPISEEAQAIHNIHPEMVRGKPKMQEILPDLLTFVDRNIIVGHGISSDINMIERAARRAGITCEFKNCRTIDTLRLARHYGDSPNNSLENLAVHFNVPREPAHRALNDVMMNIAVFKHLVRRYKTLDEIFNILNQPIKMKYMPLGKYKGRKFSEIPLHYLQRSAGMDFDQDLLYTLRLELKKRKSGNDFSQSTNPFSEL